jgi:LSD1 subclass zinc finger protein
VTLENKDIGSQPITISANKQPRDPRSHQTDHGGFARDLLGFAIDEAFIQEQRLIMERLQMNQGGEEVTSRLVASHSPLGEYEDISSVIAACGDQANDNGEHEVGNLVLRDLELIQEHQRRVLEHIRKDSQHVDKRDDSHESEKALALLENDVELEYLHRLLREVSSEQSSEKDWQPKKAALLEVDSKTQQNESNMEAGFQVKGCYPNSSYGEALQRSDELVREKGKLKDTRRDRTAQLSNGKTLKLKGTKHVLKALSKGTAVLVRCAGCQSALQAPSSCTAVYCSLCHQVTPIDLARSLADSGDAPSDGDMAVALQRQELELAQATKASKPYTCAFR